MSQLTNPSSSSPTPPVGVGCAVLGTSIITVVDSAAVVFNPIYGNNSNQAQAFVDTQWVVPVAMTVDRLYVNALYNTIDIDSDVFLVVNGVATALSVTLPAGYTGNVSNVATQISLSAGDLIVYSHTAVNAGNVLGSISMRMCTASGDAGVLEFITDDGTVTPNGSGQVFVDGTNGVFTEGTSDPNTITISIPNGISSILSYFGSYVADSVTTYMSFYGDDNNNTESEVQIIAPYNAIVDRLYIRVIASDTTDDATVTLRVNGADTALDVLLPAATTGTFSNLVDTVSVSQGDLICLSCTGTAAGTNSGILTARIRAT